MEEYVCKPQHNILSYNLKRSGSLSDYNKNLLKCIFEFLNIKELIVIMEVCRSYSKLIMSFKLVEQYIKVR